MLTSRHTATPSVTEIEVAGLCCSSEVDLIERKLGAMPGVATSR